MPLADKLNSNRRTGSGLRELYRDFETGIVSEHAPFFEQLDANRRVTASPMRSVKGTSKTSTT